jgi:transmembrane sensor
VVREKAIAIDSDAADWVVRLDRGLTDSEQQKLEEWLAGDERRSGALARAEAAWVHVERARVFHGQRELYRSPVRWPQWSAAAWVAATVAVAALAFGLRSWQEHRAGEVYAATAETSEARLADGSEVRLDPKSLVSIEYKPSIRIVRLQYGQARFEVVSDPHRPFVVESGVVRVRAVGTAFSVSRFSDSAAEVSVDKGTVEVWRLTPSPEAPVRVVAGNRILVTPEEITALEGLPETQKARATLSKGGSIYLNGWTLGEAAAEFNHFNDRSVVITDPELAAQRVVGRFQVTDPEAFVNAAAAMLDARARVDGDRLILERSPASAK